MGKGGIICSAASSLLTPLLFVLGLVVYKQKLLQAAQGHGSPCAAAGRTKQGREGSWQQGGEEPELPRGSPAPCRCHTWHRDAKA